MFAQQKFLGQIVKEEEVTWRRCIEARVVLESFCADQYCVCDDCMYQCLLALLM